jgi:hypothetical protein
MNRPASCVDSSRREFLIGTARYGMLSFVGLIAGFNAAKARRLWPKQTCINQGLCAGCAVFADCGLPQALTAKTMVGGS